MKRVFLGLSLALAATGVLAQPSGSGRSVNELAVDLLHHALREPGNVVCSPYGLASALALTSAAANGPTADQLAHALHLPANLVLDRYSELHHSLQKLEAQPGLTWGAANRLWADRPFQAAYLKAVRAALGANPSQVSFARPEEARQTINGWVKQQTCEQIPELLARGDLSPETDLVLTNALYFKGAWARPFDPKLTSLSPFHREGQPAVDVPFMHQEGLFSLASSEAALVLELPYRGQRAVMDLILPNANLASYETGLTAAGLESLLGRLNDESVGQVHVSLPRFSLKHRQDLADFVKQTGGPVPFSPQCDLTRALGPEGRGMSLGKIVQAARLDTDEAGSTAAAATAVVALRSPATEFQADRPFLVLIRDKTTGTILFLGRVADPS